jgi:hypothetical protein
VRSMPFGTTQREFGVGCVVVARVYLLSATVAEFAPPRFRNRRLFKFRARLRKSEQQCGRTPRCKESSALADRGAIRVSAQAVKFTQLCYQAVR